MIFGLFKSVDEKFGELGYAKLDDDDYIVSYECKMFAMSGNLIRKRIDIVSDDGGPGNRTWCNVLFYDYSTYDAERGTGMAIFIPRKEVKLITKKIREKGWRWR